MSAWWWFDQTSVKWIVWTIPEKKGWVNRDELFDISGKNRKKQIELAKKFKINEFPSPAGGCILTDKEYAKKIRELLKLKPKFDCLDAKALMLGRTFFDDKNIFIITRNEEEGKHIKKFVKKGDTLLEPENFSGPSVLVKGKNIEKGKEYLLKYTKKDKKDKKIKITTK